MVKEREDELENMDNQKRMERVQDKFPYDDLQLRNLDLQVWPLSSVSVCLNINISWWQT